MKNDIYDQIKRITQKLVQTNFSIHQNFPKRTENEVVWEGYKNLSFILKDNSYHDVYKALIENKDYNFLLFDGGIIQLKYAFHRNDITKQVLLYYPTPNSFKYVDSPEEFEEFEYGIKLFTENIYGDFITFPIRFDYTSTDFVEHDHPYAHATLGNYSSCRIPICSPVSPIKFVAFILRSFYFQKYKEEFEGSSFFECSLNIPRSITPLEEKILHFNFK